MREMALGILESHFLAVVGQDNVWVIPQTQFLQAVPAWCGSPQTLRGVPVTIWP